MGTPLLRQKSAVTEALTAEEFIAPPYLEPKEWEKRHNLKPIKISPGTIARYKISEEYTLPFLVSEQERADLAEVVRRHKEYERERFGYQEQHLNALIEARRQLGGTGETFGDAPPGVLQSLQAQNLIRPTPTTSVDTIRAAPGTLGYELSDPSENLIARPAQPQPASLGLPALESQIRPVAPPTSLVEPVTVQSPNPNAPLQPHERLSIAQRREVMAKQIAPPVNAREIADRLTLEEALRTGNMDEVRRLAKTLESEKAVDPWKHMDTHVVTAMKAENLDPTKPADVKKGMKVAQDRYIEQERRKLMMTDAPQLLNSVTDQLSGGKVKFFKEADPALQKQALNEFSRVQRESQPMTPEAAGRLSMMTTAIQELKNVRTMLIRPDGTINRELLATAAFPFGGLFFSKGRQFNATLRDMIGAKYRIETGAAGNQGEIDDMVTRFTPSLRDDDATVIDKLDRFEMFMNSALNLSDPGWVFRERAGLNQDPQSYYDSLRKQGKSEADAKALTRKRFGSK